MNQRLLKPHKRQVSSAKERVRLLEPDLRTPVRLRAARKGSRSMTGRNHAQAHYCAPIGKRSGPAADRAAKAEVRS